jgi:hypothetical protein
MLIEQLPPPSGDKPLTIILAPTSIIAIPAIELDEFPCLARLVAKSEFKKPTIDLFDHWKNQSDAFEALLAHLAKRSKKTNSIIGIYA